MSKFRKKPIEVEAMQFIGDHESAFAISQWAEFVGVGTCSVKGYYLKVFTLEGVMHAQPGDWIIKGVKGEFYPCKPDIFEATYEKVEEQ